MTKTDPEEIMWYSGGHTVRAGRLIGLSKVHRWAKPVTERTPYDDETACGQIVPLRISRRVTPDATDPRCKRCAKEGTVS